MPNRHTTLTSLFTDIADAIRGKTGDSAEIKADDFDTAIQSIPTGGGGESDNYFWILNNGTSAGKIGFIAAGNDWNKYSLPTLKWSTDKSTWNDIALNSDHAIEVDLPVNTKIYIKNTSDELSHSTQAYVSMDCNVPYSVGGSLTSLLNDTDGNYIHSNAFTRLFAFYVYSTKNLVDASMLKLPKSIADSCYSYMFNNCAQLTSAPTILPSLYTAADCYSNMFYGCTSLTTPPALPARRLSNNCYQAMFGGCTSLTTAPALPATTLASNCYSNMFNGCTSLTTAPALPATTLASSCYQQMFSGCSSLEIPPALPATTLQSNCYNSMFQNCTLLTHVPALPATTLASSCYVGMFSGCSTLRVYAIQGQGHSRAWNIPTSGNITGSTRAQNSMFNGVETDSVPVNFPGTTGQSFTYYTEADPIA